MKERKEKKYEYHFVNGETVVINLTLHLEGDSDWWKLLKELDRLEYNNDQTERRRHCSLEAFGEDGEGLESKEPNVLDDLIVKEKWKRTLARMTEFENVIFEYYFIKGYTQEETAKIAGVCQGMISYTIRTMRKKIKKFQNL